MNTLIKSLALNKDVKSTRKKLNSLENKKYSMKTIYPHPPPSPRNNLNSPQKYTHA